MLRFERVEVISERGHRVSEDVAGSSASNAWVIDGSTSFDAPQLDAESDARWLAQTADASLQSVYESDDSTPPRDALASAIDSIARKMSKATVSPDAKPSATVALCHVGAAALTILQLGDVLVATSRHGPIGGESIRSKMRRELERLTSGDLRSDAQLEARLREVRRARMNVEGGYWVLSDDVRALDHAEVRELSVVEGDEVLLCSDGFARVVYWFRILPDWPEVIAAVKRGEGVDIMRELRRREATDSAMTSVPQTARHDDATALLLRVTSR